MFYTRSEIIKSFWKIVQIKLSQKFGNIVNSKGEILGRHTGLYNYTIGQRKGLGISYKFPLFVIGFDKENNEVIVGKEEELYKKDILVNDINLLLVDEIKEEMEVEVKTRYSAKSAKARISMLGDNIKVVFEEPQRAITPRTISSILCSEILCLEEEKLFKLQNRI